MKKLFIIYFICLGCLFSCGQTDQFSIEGTVEGKQDGKVFLVGYNESPDTLGWANIQDGKFVLKGKVNESTEALLYIFNEERVYSVILLENANYKAYINVKDPTANQVTGTPSQDILSAYNAIGKEEGKEIDKIRNQYMVARQQNDKALMAKLFDQIGVINNKIFTQRKQFMASKMDTETAAFLLYKKRYNYPIMDKLQEEYNRLGKNAKTSVFAQKVATRIQEMSEFVAGRVAPDFTLSTPTGDSLSMYAVKGKIKLLDFWASWCAPCRAENPHMIKLYEKYHNKGLVILGISLDHQPDAWKKAIADDKLTWNQVMDTKNIAHELYKLKNGIPYVIILDENNVILASGLRGGDELEKKIAELLQ